MRTSGLSRSTAAAIAGPDQVAGGLHARRHHGGHDGAPATAGRPRGRAGTGRWRRSSGCIVRVAGPSIALPPDQSASHGTLHRVRPPGIGPRAREHQAGQPGRGGRAPLATPGHLPERRPALPGDEEIGDLRVPRRREQLLQRGQEPLPQHRGRGVHDVVRGRHRDRQVLAGRQPGRPGPVEHPLHRRVHRGRERQPGHPPVVDDVHVDDRRRAQLAPRSGPGPGRGRAGRQQPGGRPPAAPPAPRRRAVDAAVRAASAAPAVGQLGPGTGHRAVACTRGHLRAQPHARRRARSSSRAAAWPCRSPSGTAGMPMSAASRRPSSAVLHHGGGQRQVGVVAGDVQRGHGEQVPEHPAGPLALPVRGQPVAQPLAVQAGSAGSRNRMARAARLTRSRSASESSR